MAKKTDKPKKKGYRKPSAAPLSGRELDGVSGGEAWQQDCTTGSVASHNCRSGAAAGRGPSRGVCKSGGREYLPFERCSGGHAVLPK